MRYLCSSDSEFEGSESIIDDDIEEQPTNYKLVHTTMHGCTCIITAYYHRNGDDDEDNQNPIDNNNTEDVYGL